MSQELAYFKLQGGENLVVPPLTADPSEAQLCYNYELDAYGRPRSVYGYARYDGRLATNDSYAYMIVDEECAIAEGSTVTQGGESAYVLYCSDLVPGSYLAEEFLIPEDYLIPEGRYLIVADPTGDFVPGILQVGGVDTCYCFYYEDDRVPDYDLHEEYAALALAYHRTTILAVPGAGSVLGVWIYEDEIYAFRNDATETNALMYKATGTGWEEVPLGSTLAFTAGTVLPPQGAIVTGGTSGASAEIWHVVVTSGDWSTSDAAGYLVIGEVTNGPFQAEALTDDNSGTYTGTGAETAVTLAPDGRYEFDNYNVMAIGGGWKMYGADGKNMLFEFDGTRFIQIPTGEAVDTPTHVKGHKLHLFYANVDGTVGFSGFKTPRSMDVADGAGNIGLSDFCIGFEMASDETLICFCKNSTHLVYGASSADWEVKQFSDNTGATEWTIQRLGSPIYLDHRGITDLNAVDTYGNFESANLAWKVKPFLEEKRSLVTASMISRNDSLYRLFYSDGFATSMRYFNTTLEGTTTRSIGCTRLRFPDPVACCCSEEDSSGTEVMLFGSTNGMVYRMGVGYSFDGEQIDSRFSGHYNNLKLPRNRKRIPKVVLECEAGGAGRLQFLCRFANSYGISVDLDSEFVLTPSGGIWDYSSWNAFVWYTGGANYGHAYVNGAGLAFALSIRSLSAVQAQHTLNGLMVHYMIRGLQR